MNITKEMTIGEVVRNYPEKADTLMEFGMGCVHCPSAQFETLEQAAEVHGIKLDEFLEALNR
jgi:hybrid cluster-associated redox disulfide protein